MKHKIFRKTMILFGLGFVITHGAKAGFITCHNHKHWCHFTLDQCNGGCSYIDGAPHKKCEELCGKCNSEGGAQMVGNWREHTLKCQKFGDHGYEALFEWSWFPSEKDNCTNLEECRERHIV